MSDALNLARVLVVGGSSGIGLATARSFAAAGAQVALASRGGEKLERAVAEVGHGATAVTLDTGNQAAVEAAFAGEAYDHVVVTASQTATGPIRELSLADAYKAMESKFWGAYRVARAARIARDGSLTLVSGLLATRPSKMSVLQGAINAGFGARACT
jgi:NAD(P)-dependent dehydrogenase (short-subunit alcohol dehydrogenase family)